MNGRPVRAPGTEELILLPAGSRLPKTSTRRSAITVRMVRLDVMAEKVNTAQP